MKVKISKDLKNYIVPTELRDNSIFETGFYTPGSRIKIPDCKFIRVYTAWGHESYTTIDVDLSAGFLSGDKFDRISFYNQATDVAVHSGDFTYCDYYNPETSNVITSEFIDIDFNRVSKEDYIIFNSYVYRGPNFKDMYAYFGLDFIDERISTKKDNKIDIRNSFYKVRINSEGNNYIPFAIDLKNKELVIIDKCTKQFSGLTIDNLRDTINVYKDNYLNAVKTKPNMYSLIKMYCNAKNYDIVNTDEDILIDTKYIQENLQKIINILKEG